MSCGFNSKHYVETLTDLEKKGYHITPVSDFFKGRFYDKHILLRHDVDLSLDYALDMALLEKDLGISSTYYILLQSDLCNAMSPEGMELIKRIKGAGHEIGLHIDTRYYQGVIEFSTLEKIAKTTITMWSKHLHNITPDVPDYLKRYGDPNCAMDAGYNYIADSGMTWRNGCFCSSLKSDRALLLIHPEWWTVPKNNRWEILDFLELQTVYERQKAFNSFREILKERVLLVEP